MSTTEAHYRVSTEVSQLSQSSGSYGRTDGRTNEDGCFVAQRLLRFRNAHGRIRDFDLAVDNPMRFAPGSTVQR